MAGVMKMTLTGRMRMLGDDTCGVDHSCGVDLTTDDSNLQEDPLF